MAAGIGAVVSVAAACVARWIRPIRAQTLSFLSMLPAAAPDEIVASSEIAALKARQDVLQREVDELRALVERLYAELGIAKP